MAALDEPLVAVAFLWYDSLHPLGVLPTAHIEGVWKERWFAKGPDQVLADAELARFEPLWRSLSQAYREKAWAPNSLLETVAAIILFDQVPRNIFRGTRAAYSSDDIGYELASRLHSSPNFPSLPMHMKYTVIIALVHSEKLSDQDTVGAFAASLPSYLIGDRFRAIAANHRDRIALFGRFPERNAVLGRESTPAETAYLRSVSA
jgi:uncharacterized protein (DUF924 family)